jgi:hypothetical protein
MDKGILYFCFDTVSFRYSNILNKSSVLAKKYLDLPITVVTDKDTAERLNFECDKILIDHIDNTNVRSFKGKKVEWKNMERSLAFDLSPYNTTLVMDVDYFCFTDYLSNLIDMEQDFLVHQDVHDLAGFDVVDKHELSIPLVWATIMIFKKTDKVKTIFEMVKYVKQNYMYYRRLYRIKYSNFRNDYAFSIALHQLEGFASRKYVIPNMMCQLDQRARLLFIDEDGIEFENNNCLFKCKQDVHVLEKEFFNV